MENLFTKKDAKNLKNLKLLLNYNLLHLKLPLTSPQILMIKAIQFTRTLTYIPTLCLIKDTIFVVNDFNDIHYHKSIICHVQYR